MASTYSPLLRIQLIGTGEQAGTWGATTNVNLGTLLEQAIAGTANVDVAAGNVTLTDLDGASDQARCAILNITGAPGVSRNVIAPATSKIYFVLNGSDAEVVLKTASSAGLAIPAGTSVWAVYNGSDFQTATLITGENLYLTGLAPRISGDFSTNSPHLERVMFQTTTPDGATGVRALPNGVGTNASYGCLNSTDANNYNLGNINIDATTFEILTEAFGSATDIPILVSPGGSETARFTTDGKLGIGTSTPTEELDVNGAICISGSTPRITGDFSTGLDQRLQIQTNVTNGQTGLRVVPNGTSTNSSVGCLNSTSTTVYNLGNINIDATTFEILTVAFGGATNIPIIISPGIDGAVTFETNGSVTIKNVVSVPGTPTGAGALYVEGGALKYKGSSGTVTTIAAA